MTFLGPPFTLESATAKVRAVEDVWNSRDASKVARHYSTDSQWRNRSEFFRGRGAIQRFLADKWDVENEYRLVADLWAFGASRIAVRFCCEWRDANGDWFRSYGNEQCEFDAAGLIARRDASVNDVPIAEHDRKFFWPVPGRRPQHHAGLSGLGL